MPRRKKNTILLNANMHMVRNSYRTICSKKEYFSFRRGIAYKRIGKIHLTLYSIDETLLLKALSIPGYLQTIPIYLQQGLAQRSGAY